MEENYKKYNIIKNWYDVERSGNEINNCEINYFDTLLNIVNCNGTKGGKRVK